MSFKFPPFSIVRHEEMNPLYAYLFQIFTRITGSNLIASKVVEIGSWDMDADVVKTVEVPVQLSVANLINTTFAIFDDTQDGIVYTSPYNGIDYVALSTPTELQIFRKAGGTFDNPGFNDTAVNRGYVTIWYTT